MTDDALTPEIQRNQQDIDRLTPEQYADVLSTTELSLEQRRGLASIAEVGHDLHLVTATELKLALTILDRWEDATLAERIAVAEYCKEAAIAAERWGGRTTEGGK